ncbi:hypothetical protein [Paraburkholderia hayleyella]|uniref:hypothetical protein n=1 Tax=Paraburkholderia hayleyella TaxID=2152889 RepID=UPI001291025E|nr:hypothetical protein [Paraburkholderia hayleyella]
MMQVQLTRLNRASLYLHDHAVPAHAHPDSPARDAANRQSDNAWHVKDTMFRRGAKEIPDNTDIFNAMI